MTMIKQLKKWIFCTYACFNLITVQTVKAAEDWTGFYSGVKAGAALEQFALSTIATPNLILNSAQAQVLNNAGQQSLHSNGFLTGVTGGYNWRSHYLLFGLQTDIQTLSNSGSITSEALPDPTVSGNQCVISTYGNNNWLLTARPRLGVISPFGVMYATGGLGLTWLQSDFLLTSNADGVESKKANSVQAGYVIGGGIETSLAQNLSLQAEYLFENYPTNQAYQMNQSLPLGQNTSNSVNLEGHLITVGLNYHFNQHLPLWFQTSDLWNASVWETEIGARMFISSGRVGAPDPLLNFTNIGNILASRLIFSDLIGISEEVYGRVDHSSGAFLKGFLGAGSITNGQLNDEDFPAQNAYSNTLSDAQGNLSYGVIDLGYSFLKNSSAKTGIFVGYDYNAQNIKIYGCQQLAGDSICQNSNELANFLALSEADSFNSLRVGLASQYQITKQLSFSPEVAYLPLVNFNGLDMHNARQLLGPENSNRGDGTMLEASLDYQLDDTWSVGLGGRYWAWNMHSGTLVFDFLGDPDIIVEPAHFNTTRYGGFLQVNYRHRDLPSLDITQPSNNWQGIYIGGSVGSAWSQNAWSDPFGMTAGNGGYVNAPGFGDHISSSGPLGGGVVNFNWQTEQWVYGIGGSMNGCDIRGENTLFSGLGGINGQSIIRYFGTIVGRLGHVFNDSLIYINTGTAILNTQYNLNGNTAALTLGTDTQVMNNWGWTVGAGLDYAFNDHWSSNVEYEYIGMPNTNIAFPNLQVINQYNIAVNQSINLVKVGVNYKLI